jgi:hypothetical protein
MDTRGLQRCLLLLIVIVASGWVIWNVVSGLCCTTSKTVPAITRSLAGGQ